jgi:hypothetical protein
MPLCLVGLDSNITGYGVGSRIIGCRFKDYRV